MQAEPTTAIDFGQAKKKSYLYEHMLNNYWDAREKMEEAVDMLRLTDMISSAQWNAFLTLTREISNSARDVAGVQANLASELEGDPWEEDR